VGNGAERNQVAKKGGQEGKGDVLEKSWREDWVENRTCEELEKRSPSKNKAKEYIWKGDKYSGYNQDS